MVLELDLAQVVHGEEAHNKVHQNMNLAKKIGKKSAKKSKNIFFFQFDHTKRMKNTKNQHR